MTGAAGGIGEAVARRLARAGARVACVDLDEEGVRRVAAEIGGPAFPVDLADPGAVDRIPV